MKRNLILGLAAGLVTAAGIGIGMHAAESGNRGDGASHRGSHAGGHGMRNRGGRRHRGGHGMHRMMKRFDTDKNGQLTQAEIDGARRALVTKHDANSDGRLTLAEFRNLWLEVRNRRMVRSFQRIDEDGDAAITVEEFLEPFAKVVQRMDRNEDGVLDKKDRRRHGMRHRGYKRHGMKRRGSPDGDDAGADDGEKTEQ